MKKILVLVFLSLVLTGCRASVNLTVDNNKITEEIKLIASNKEEYSEIKNWNGFPLTKYFDQELNNPYGNEKEAGVSYYNPLFDEESLTVNSTETFSFTDHSRSSIVRNCFRYYNVIRQGQKLILSTSNGVICSFSDFDINIKTDYLVTNNNANKTDKDTNTFTWSVTKSNKNEASVYLEIDLSKKYNETDKDSNGNASESAEINNQTKSNTVVYIIIFIALLILGLIAFLLKRNKSASKI